MRWVSVSAFVSLTAFAAAAQKECCACPPASSSSLVSSPISSSPIPSASSTPPPPASLGRIVSSTVLIIAKDDDEVETASPVLDGYGIPWQKLLVPQGGAALPTLNNTATEGLFGSIILTGGIVYEYSGAYRSALTDDQWQQLYNYQSAFNVRMVRFNEYPGSNFGTTPVDPSNPGCCGDDMDQGISLVDVTSIHSANLKPNAPLSMKGLYHYPAKITDPATTTMFAALEPVSRFPGRSVGAVVNNFNGREQMVFFSALAPKWSLTSVFLNHASIHWMTRGLFTGKRKVHLSPQVDDLQIPTALFYPAGTKFQISTADLDAHVHWQAQLNTHLPAGSEFRLEMGHNGNGNILEATNSTASKDKCNPNNAVVFPMPPATPIEFKKPVGSGVDNWPASYQSYQWSDECSSLGTFANWFRKPDNLNAFSHVSHTFSHEELNNATYADAIRETRFNQAWLKQVGIDRADRFSPKGLIPPAITGVKNGDAVKAWADSGITFIVGDNTRPTLRNQKSKYWPLATTVEMNGYDGVWIIPRYTTTIYFNCDKPECILKEWQVIAGRTGTFDDLLTDARLVNTHYIMSLSADPFMFHQANMRQVDMPEVTVGSQTGKMSLLMSWMETITQELTRLTNWPITSLKHDDLGQYFLDRMALDGCQPTSKYVYGPDNKSIVQVIVSTKDNACSVPVPITIPQGSATGTDIEQDVVGSEPPIIWVTMDGSPVTVTLTNPVQV